MRRRDGLVLIILLTMALVSWLKLWPPVDNDDVLLVTDDHLAVFSSWSGPIEPARTVHAVSASADESQKLADGGSVKGASTVGAFSPPVSQLPIEEYYGRPFIASLSDLLIDLNVVVYQEDIVEAFPAPEFGLGSHIKIYRALPVTIVDWGRAKTYRTWQTTVEGLFDEQNLELGDNDRVEPGLKSRLAAKDGQATLTITRVAITEVKLKETIEFNRIQREDPELPRGRTKLTKGVLGERTKTFRVTRENGVEVKHELLKNDITREPSHEVKIIGTKILIGKTYNGRASWYKYNSTKVASDLFKRGTNLRITNLNSGKVIFVNNDGCICADTGYVVDLHPDHFIALGGTLGQGVLQNVRVDEILN